MSQIIDLRNSGGGELIILGKAIVLPASGDDSVRPLTGSIRHNDQLARIEAFIGGQWRSIINEGGAVAPHGHNMTDIIGLAASLANKAEAIHNHPIAQVTGLQAALDGKANVNHTHVITQDDIFGLNDDLAAINQRIDGKADAGHTHPPAAVFETISACFPNRPAGGASLVWMAGFNCTFPANFAGSVGRVEANPIDPYVVTVYRDAVQVGTITVGPDGSVIFASMSSAPVVVTAGQALRFVAQAAADPTLRTLSFTMISQRN